PRAQATVSIKEGMEAATPMVFEFGNARDDKNYYARVGGSDRVYAIEKSKVDFIQTAELIDLTIWQLASDNDIRGIKLAGWKRGPTDPPFTVDLERKSATEWSARQPDKYTVDAVKAEEFARSLKQVRMDSVVKLEGDPAPEHKLGK